jgi:CPA2 family monovalent cation:H+ antiporter-2
MHIPLLADIITILGVSIATFLVCSRLRVPAIVGFLLAGVLTGPDGLGLVKAVHEVEVLAEIGIVLLLFTIGLEFSLAKLLQIRQTVLLGGALQVGLTLLAVYGLARWSGQASGPAVLLGFLLSLSSTAIVLKLLQERAEIDSPHGRAALGILIFQDLAVVLMMLVTPLLGGSGGGSALSLLALAGKGLGIVALLLVLAQRIVPWTLFQVARTRSGEVFSLSVVLICLAIAWLTSLVGLSLGLGAFLAGLILSESEYGHAALSGILPLRDVFSSFFFVSVGMLLDLGLFGRQPGTILLVTALVIGGKALLAGAAGLALRLPPRTLMLVSLALAQVGEFSFVLARLGLQYKLLAPETYQLFLATSVLTMAATPFLLRLGHYAVQAIARLPLPSGLKARLEEVSQVPETRQPLRDHLVIVGFGTNGQNVARAARAAAIPYLILELNAETVRREKKRGEPIAYGDATHEAVLRHLHIEAARVVVLGVSDPTATRRITELVRRLSPRVHLIVRTQYVHEIAPLYRLGANDVVAGEYETSVEVFTRVLLKYLVPRDEIERFIAEIRADGYEMFRSWRAAAFSTSDFQLHLDEIDVGKVRVGDQAPVAGKSLSEIELRRRYGATLVAIRREGRILPNPHGGIEIRAGDELYLLASPEHMPEASRLFQNPQPQRLVDPADASLQ